MDIHKEINYSYVPKYSPTGVNILVRLDKPTDIRYGNSKVNLNSGMTTGGILLPTKEVMANSGLQTDVGCHMAAAEGHETDVRIKLEGETEATVIKIAPSAFKREGLADMLVSIRPGTRVWIKDFARIPLRDPEGRRTLYYYIQEHQVVGLVEEIVDEF